MLIRLLIITVCTVIGYYAGDAYDEANIGALIGFVVGLLVTMGAGRSLGDIDFPDLDFGGIGGDSGGSDGD